MNKNYLNKAVRWVVAVCGGGGRRRRPLLEHENTKKL